MPYSQTACYLDWYMDQPQQPTSQQQLYQQLYQHHHQQQQQQQTTPQVVIRIYGSNTLSGQKSCLHLHGVFPYFYVADKPVHNAVDNDVDWVSIQDHVALLNKLEIDLNISGMFSSFSRSVALSSIPSTPMCFFLHFKKEQ